MTIEGKATAKAVSNAAENAGIDMPIANIVVALTEAAITVNDAVGILLSRPLKEE